MFGRIGSAAGLWAQTTPLQVSLFSRTQALRPGARLPCFKHPLDLGLRRRRSLVPVDERRHLRLAEPLAVAVPKLEQLAKLIRAVSRHGSSVPARRKA